VKFNGTYKQFVDTFGVDPAATSPGTTPTPNPNTGEETTYEMPKEGFLIHQRCPHCGKLIY
jgi:uncharacterized OB-fold protein